MPVLKTITITALVILLSACQYKAINVQGYKISGANVKQVAELVYKNETGGNPQYLMFWSAKEPFPSLGIGHFIWFPANYNSSFGNTLPLLIDFYKSKNIKVPKLLQQYNAPWNSKQEFETYKQNNPDEVAEIIKFFEKTKHIQVEYMFNRIINSFNNIVQTSSNKSKVIFQFNRIISQKNGIYLLVDYTNFKGEGATENSISGLRNVLENMKGVKQDATVYYDFANSCKDVLINRVYLSNNYSETKFLQGWAKRCNSYIIN